MVVLAMQHILNLISSWGRVAGFNARVPGKTLLVWLISALLSFEPFSKCRKDNWPLKIVFKALGKGGRGRKRGNVCLGQNLFVSVQKRLGQKYSNISGCDPWRNPSGRDLSLYCIMIFPNPQMKCFFFSDFGEGEDKCLVKIGERNVKNSWYFKHKF